ncbi:MAG: hypothetical protein ABH849_00040, partial [Nanoarchaeota archaeon]
ELCNKLPPFHRVNKELSTLKIRLEGAEGLLKSTLDKLYRLDFTKGSRISFLIEELEGALRVKEGE